MTGWLEGYSGLTLPGIADKVGKSALQACIALPDYLDGPHKGNECIKCQVQYEYWFHHEIIITELGG